MRSDARRALAGKRHPASACAFHRPAGRGRRIGREVREDDAEPVGTREGYLSQRPCGVVAAAAASGVRGR